MGRIWSLGQIAKELRVESHRVRFVIETRQIAPIGCVGNSHANGDEQLHQVRAALDEVAKGKGGPARRSRRARRRPVAASGVAT